MIPYFGLIAIKLGPVPIQVWGFLVSLGVVAGLLVGRAWLKKRKIATSPFLNLAVWIIISALFFSRVFYVFFQDGNLLSRTGFMSTGGFFGAAFVIFVYYKKLGAKIWPYLDSIAFAFPFGWAVGRMGCFLIHDHPGSLTKSFLAVNFVDGARWDLGLLESLLMVLIAIIFVGLNQRRRPEGFFPGLLMMIYGVGRFGLDFLRAADLPDSDARWLGLTFGQYGALLILVGGIYWWEKRK